MSTDSRQRRPWDVPDCPECGGHIFVERSRTTEFEWQCFAGWCDGGHFSTEVDL